MKSKLKWILMLIFKCLPLEGIIDLIVKLLRDLAKKTDNKIDDAIVEFVAEMLYTAFELNTQEKLEHLDEQFVDGVA